MNFPELESPVGILKAVTSAEYYRNGKLKSVRLNEANLVNSPSGNLVPAFASSHVRKKYVPSLSFYPSGAMKSIRLEEQKQNIGPYDLPAELITWYESGQIQRIFPRDGRLSGYWTIEDETPLAHRLKIKLEGLGNINNLISGAYFYQSGKLKSLTLWPGEKLSLVAGQIGTVTCRIGFSLYENGKLKSLEPASPWPVKTVIGDILAYDPEASGICADHNSLKFDEQGKIIGLISSQLIEVKNMDGKIQVVKPKTRIHHFRDNAKVIVPMGFSFGHNTINIKNEDLEGQNYSFSLWENTFIVKPFILPSKIHISKPQNNTGYIQSSNIT